MNETSDMQNPPMEFLILEVKAVGFVGQAWFHGETNLGTHQELEGILNQLGSEGWDIAQIMPPAYGASHPRIFLRRKAR